MNRLLLLVAIGAGALLAVAPSVFDSQVLHAETPLPTSNEGAEGVLVLQSGGVLVGRVSHDGERYVVAGPQSQLSVAATDVAFACRSMDEAYQEKRQRMISPASTAAAHLELAEWCLRYNLTSQAAEEIEAARKLEPNHPKLSLVERRLVVATRPPTTIAHNGSQTKSGMAKSSAELDQLRAMARVLPDEAVERFTRKVQPVLVNNCTTSGCHRPNGEQEFQLDRAMLHDMGNRRTTLRNLEATLALVDHATPQLSPLLSVPRSPHGGSKQPLLGVRQEQQFQQLVDWVALVTNTEAPSSVAPLADVQQPKTETSQATPTVVPASHELPVLPVELTPRVQFGAIPKPLPPADPFDPEIFNNLKSTPGAAAGLQQN